MNKRTFIALVIVFAGVSAFLFHSFYEEARDNAFTKLHDEQMIHAKQAAHGIEDYFGTWARTLSSLAKMHAIIDADTDGKRYMKLFYEAHRDQIRSITRMDEKGTITHTVPYSRSQGRNIAGQTHVQEILKEHKPVVSDVFRTVQGFDAIALHVPVFRGAVFKGTIAIVIKFESLAKRYFDIIKIGETGYAWVVSRDGTQLYSPVPGFIGKSVFENIKGSPSLIVMVNDMLKGHEGTATYTLDRIGDRHVRQIRKSAVYMPIHIENTFWSIVVASDEQDALSGLVSFRNHLALVIGALFICGIVFSTVGAKAWFIVKEEEKRKQVEIELRNSEQRYRRLFEQNPAPMLIYQRGTLKMLAVNDAFVHHYGYTMQKALSLHLTDLYPEEEKNSIRELAARLEGQAYAGEWHHLKADGSIINIVARSHDIDYMGADARIAVMTDITDRKQAEDALRQSEEKFFKAFHATPDAIVISRESDGLLLEVNDVFLRLTGYSREEIQARTTVTLDLWADTNDRERYVAAVKSEGRVHAMEARFLTKSGKVLDGLVSGESIVLGAQPCLLTIIRDITQRKKTEAELEKYRLHLEELVNERTADLEAKTDELEQSQKALQLLLKDVNEAKRELETANERLKELDRLKSMFIASMSHELRTPLNSIIGFTGMTLQGLSGELNDEQKDNLARVYQAAKHLLALISDVIDIAKIEAGRVDSFPEEVSLNNIIDEAIATVEPQLKEKRLTLAVDVPADMKLNTDRKRLLQCLINLLSNGVKYTEKGGITLTVSERDSAVEISVTDTGIGIAEKDMPKLFDAFERLDTHLRVKAGGTGRDCTLPKNLLRIFFKAVYRLRAWKGRGAYSP